VKFARNRAKEDAMKITPAKNEKKNETKTPQTLKETAVLRAKSGVRAGDLYLHWPRGSNDPG
jgi:hypothetical protein